MTRQKRVLNYRLILFHQVRTAISLYCSEWIVAIWCSDLFHKHVMETNYRRQHQQKNRSRTRFSSKLHSVKKSNTLCLLSNHKAAVYIMQYYKNLLQVVCISYSISENKLNKRLLCFIASGFVLFIDRIKINYIVNCKSNDVTIHWPFIKKHQLFLQKYTT